MNAERAFAALSRMFEESRPTGAEVDNFRAKGRVVLFFLRFAQGNGATVTVSPWRQSRGNEQKSRAFQNRAHIGACRSNGRRVDWLIYRRFVRGAKS